MRPVSGSWAAAEVVGVLVLLAFLAGCESTNGRERNSAVDEPTTGIVVGAGPTGETAATILRPGCGEYCQQAGGYGAGEETGTPMRMIVLSDASPVTPLEDGAVPVELTCVFTGPCTGALLLNLAGSGGRVGREVARVDLDVAPDTTRTLGVPLSPEASEQIRDIGSLELTVTSDVLPSLLTLPVEERGQWVALMVGNLAVSATP